ncbi:haloacid dehalogenase [Pseudalgibacter alginicilyticus]|uniref:Haloacid dehalogenase n=1 Tax=Pseudalgibacter alginicilyticus TaxID=1736674 RepID=A0A0P0D351_9FLAO|nr:HAD family hydrolase [Pseudalgibacter alginicilyticus]ALJ04356.1 haloacid dehalogenase [Pseudalgibacter alginicilyticus]
MNLSKVKLVVTDMDGTLLNSKHEVSSHFFKLFEEMTTHDILFVAASGRPHYSITEKLNTIKNDIIIVSENGGLISKNKETLLSTPLEADSLLEIINLIQPLENTHPVFCGKTKAFVKSGSKKLLNILTEYYPYYTIIENTSEIYEDIYKVALFHEENSEKYIYPHVKHLEANFKVKTSAHHWVDISENLANKGHAIKLLQDSYNISSDETMVFGDYNNDLEMLKLAYFSYAMKNAHPNVKKVARFETKTNDEFGVEHILEKLVKEKSKN